MPRAGLARGVFGGTLPWELVGLGAAIGIAVILVDRRLAARSADFRMPVLAVALGMYLPLKLSAAILAGGLVGALARRGAGKPVEAGGSPRLLVAPRLVTRGARLGILPA